MISAPRHLERTLGDRWRRYRRAFDRCREHFSEDSVHQLRVETRRLLALLDLLDSFAPCPELKALRRAVKAFFRRFARLRDTQVQLGLVDKHRRRFPEIGSFAKRLARVEKRLIRKLDRQIRRAGRRKLRKLATALQKELEATLASGSLHARGQAMVTRKVRTAFNRAVALRRCIDPERPLTIHRTRIAFKRFRYLVELLRPLLPGASLRRLREMHDYQTLMGEIQDLEVLQGTLAEFVEDKPEAATALKRFQRELERQHTKRITGYVKRADELLQFWPLTPARPGHA